MGAYREPSGGVVETTSLLIVEYSIFLQAQVCCSPDALPLRADGPMSPFEPSIAEEEVNWTCGVRMVERAGLDAEVFRESTCISNNSGSYVQE